MPVDQGHEVVVPHCYKATGLNPTTGHDYNKQQEWTKQL